MDFDFGDEAKVWTVETLNTRLDMLQSGEVLRIEDLSNEIYHGAKGVSCSKLKVFMDCEYRYWATFVEKSVPFEYKSYFAFGSAGHTTILEPEKFDSEYCKMPEYSGEGSKAKKDHFKAMAASQGKTILTAEQWGAMPALRRSVDANPMAKILTSGGVAEVSYFKRDEDTGLVIKCRPDYMIGDLISDLKTSDTVDPRFLPTKFSRLGYDIQDAMYCDVVGVDDFVFVAIESKPPYIVTAPIVFDDVKRRLARLNYRKALSRLAECMRSNKWAMYTQGKLEIKATKFDLIELEKLEGDL